MNSLPPLANLFLILSLASGDLFFFMALGLSLCRPPLERTLSMAFRCKRNAILSLIDGRVI